MSILAVGVSHQETPIELRERLAVPAARIEEALDRLSQHAAEGVVLSTCNRTEVYASVGHFRSGLRALTRFFAETSELDEDELSRHLRSHWQEAAIRHLFRVAAGLDSMMLGEGQILGQVATAYRLAQSRQRLSPVLARLFDCALAVGKRARSQTSIARHAVSVSQAAVELAEEALGSTKEATLLVLGTGKMGELTARALQQRGVRRVLIVSRSEQRAERLVAHVGGEAWGIDRLEEGLGLADVVISSTTGEGYAITPRHLPDCLSGRSRRTLVIVDIGMPRNVEPATADLPGIRLFNIDDLRRVCATNVGRRKHEVEKVEAIIEDELERYVRWWQAREVAPTITEMVRRADGIRREELARALGRMSPLSERDANAINALSMAIVNKLLHPPIVRLKERGAGLDGKHYLHAVRELFDLPRESDAE